jgi:branched-chain amino acid transport system ATP-binding protein
MIPPALETIDLVAGYDPEMPILRGASIRVLPGEIVALLGPNGAGKSTLVKTAAGLLRASSGAIRLHGRDIAGVAAHLLARQGLGFVPQTENVFADMSIADTLALAAAVLPRGERGARRAAMAAMFPDLARDPRLRASRLSGGQRQMLAMARALIPAPRVLLLDEPTAGLSPRLAGEAMQALRRVRETGVSILLVEQNARLALRHADRAYVLVGGRPVHEAPAAALRDDPGLGALYLGRQAA